MFVIRSLVGTTIKPFLGRYIKGNVQIPANSESTFELKNIELKQDALEEMLSNKIHVEHASAASLRVNVSTSGIELCWGHIKITLGDETLAPKEQSSSLTESKALGSSLVDGNTVDEAITSSLIMPNLVDKIDNITNSIHHVIPLITVQSKLGILTFINSRFNVVKGLQVEAITLKSVEQHLVASAKDVAMTLDLKFTIGLVTGDVNQLRKLAIGSSFAFDQNATTSDQKPSVVIKKMCLTGLFGLNIEASNVSLDQFVLEVESLLAKTDSSVEVVNGTWITAKYFDKDNCSREYLKRDEQSVQLPLLIDTETIFMFHDQSRAPPIASDESTQLYRERTFARADHAVRVACATLNINGIELEKLKTHFVSAPSASSAKTFAIDVDVDEQLSVVLPDGSQSLIKLWEILTRLPGTVLTANNVNLFVDESVNWYVDAERASISSATVTNVKAAGCSNRIGVNVKSVNVTNVEQFRDCVKRLIPPPDLNAAPFSVCVHVEKGRLAPSTQSKGLRKPWLTFLAGTLILPNTDIRVHELDVFTLSTSGDIVVAASAINTTHLRLTGFQLLLGPETTSIRVMLLQLLADQAFFNSVTDRISSLAEPKPEPKAEPPASKSFNLSEHKMVKQYVAADKVLKVAPSVDKIKLSIGKLLVQSSAASTLPVTAQIDRLKFRKSDARMLARFERLQVSTNTLNRAILIRHLTFTAIGDKHDYVIHFSDTRENPVVLDFDQAFVDYLSTLSGPAEGPLERDVEPTIIRSLKVSPIKLRVSFKPGDASPDTSVPQFLRWIPIKDAAIKIGVFECFDMDVNAISMAFGMHVISDKKNLARLAGGVQLIKAPAEIMKNLTELILVPISSNSTNTDIISRVQGVSAKTVVSVLNVGASGSRIQPSGIKEGMIQAGQVFQRDMNTVIAFVGGEEQVDVASLPMMIIRPITSPIAKILSGVCNQLDPKRRNV